MRHSDERGKQKQLRGREREREKGERGAETDVVLLLAPAVALGEDHALDAELVGALVELARVSLRALEPVVDERPDLLVDESAHLLPESDVGVVVVRGIAPLVPGRLAERQHVAVLLLQRGLLIGSRHSDTGRQSQNK